MAGWTTTQHNRLNELDADAGVLNAEFETIEERNQAFQTLEKKLARSARKTLAAFRRDHRRPKRSRLCEALVSTLIDNGFVQVTTPTIMAASLLKKMGINETHPLSEQIFWLGKSQCLRPMLAPHLYYVIKDLLRIWETPVGLFEIGSCFRKETQGACHANEFTMLNLCEFGLPEDQRESRLKELAALVMETAGIEAYQFEVESSAVYGDTLDVTVTDPMALELGSAAMGPHPLDYAWQINETWVGIGFGVERLLMAGEKSPSLSRFTPSLTRLDGIRLNL